MSEIVQAFLASRDRPEIALKRSATRRPVSAGRYMVETVHVPAVKQANKEMHGLGAALRLSRVLRSFPRKRQSSNLIPGSPLARGRTEKMSIRRRECVQSSFVGSSGQICSDLNLDRRSTNHPHCDFWFVQSECPPGQSYDGLKYSIKCSGGLCSPAV